MWGEEGKELVEEQTFGAGQGPVPSFTWRRTQGVRLRVLPRGRWLGLTGVRGQQGPGWARKGAEPRGAPLPHFLKGPGAGLCRKGLAEPSVAGLGSAGTWEPRRGGRAS